MSKSHSQAKINSKKMSTMMANIGNNTYRAFKLTTDKSSIDQKTMHRNHITPLVYRNDHWIYPFGFKEKRFNWQTDAILNQHVQLGGTMRKYCYKKTHSVEWDGFVINSDNVFPGRVSQNIMKQKMQTRLKENENTIRTITPKRAKVYIHIFMFII